MNKKTFAVIIFIFVVVLAGQFTAPISFAQEDKKPLTPPVIQETPRGISPELQKVIVESPTSTIGVFIHLSYDLALQIRDKMDASGMRLRIKELEKQIQEAASSSVRGDSPEYLALFKELDDAELAWRQEFAKRLEAGYKPAQDGVSLLVESLGGEVTYRYTVFNLLAARIEARQIPELIKSPLVWSVSDVQVFEALGTAAPKSDEAKLPNETPLTNNKFLMTSLIAILVIGFISFLVLRRQRKT